VSCPAGTVSLKGLASNPGLHQVRILPLTRDNCILGLPGVPITVRVSSQSQSR
jgi:hypothetical protein